MTPDVEIQIKNEIHHLREVLSERISALEKVYDERFKALADALKLQAREYERRLESLNHEAARIAESQAASVNAERYASDLNSINEKLVSLKENLNEKYAELRDALSASINELKSGLSKNTTELRESMAKNVTELRESAAEKSSESKTYQAKGEGKSQGVSGVVAYIIIAISFLISIAGLIRSFLK